MKKFFKKFFAILLISQIIAPGAMANGIAESVSDKKNNFVPNQVIIKYKDNYMDATNPEDQKILSQSFAAQGSEVEILGKDNTILVTKDSNFIEKAFNWISGVSDEQTVENMIQFYEKNPNVEFAQKNFVYEIPEKKFQENIFSTRWENTITSQVTPNALQTNEPLYHWQWYLKNTWQDLPGRDPFYQRMSYWKDDSGNPLVMQQAKVGNDIKYERAKQLYDIARDRLSPTQKSKKVVVAILDSSFNAQHEELQWLLWDGSRCNSPNGWYMGWCQYGYDAANQDKYPHSEVSQHSVKNHGTSVASMIAMNSNNNKGLVGINSNNVELMLINGMKDGEQVYTSDNVIRWINFAKENNAEIMNMSFGGIKSKTHAPEYDRAYVDAMYSFPWIMVNSSGNDWAYINHNVDYWLPGDYRDGYFDNLYSFVPNFQNKVLIVGAIGPGENIGMSNYGEHVDIMAPGIDIAVAGKQYFNDEIGGDYDLALGTSFAAPIITASLAFAKSAYPEKSMTELRNIMLESGRNIDQLQWKNAIWKTLDLGAMMERLEREAGFEPPVEESPKPPKPEPINITGLISTENTQWTNQNITITLTTSHEINTPDGWTKKWDSGKIFTKNVSENGEISVHFSDANGNSGNSAINISHIDKTKPSLNISSPVNNFKTKNASEKILFSGNDSESGIKHYECQNNNENYTSCTNPWTINLTNGNNNITIKAVDKANNSIEKSITIIKEEDIPVPTPTPTPPSIPLPIIKNKDIISHKDINEILLNWNQLEVVEVRGLPPGLIFDKNSWKIFGKTAEIGIFNIVAIYNDNREVHFQIISKTDNQWPVITINGNEHIILKNTDTYNEPWATCVDNIDSTCHVKIEGEVKNWVIWNYIITYSAVDVHWNVTKKSRTIEVQKDNKINPPVQNNRNILGPGWIPQSTSINNKKEDEEIFNSASINIEEKILEKVDSFLSNINFNWIDNIFIKNHLNKSIDTLIKESQIQIIWKKWTTSSFKDIIEGNINKYKNLIEIDLRLFIYQNFIFSYNIEIEWNKAEKKEYINQYIQLLNHRNNLMKQFNILH